MEGVKRNADRKENVEMRRLIDDADAGEQPLEILEQKISVLEKTEHAQIHANARDEPPLLGALTLRLGNLATEPKIHRRGREQERGERRIPGAVKNVTRNDEQVFSHLPSAKTPVERDDDYEKNDEGERIKKHGEVFELRCRRQLPIYASHNEADLLDVVFESGKIDIHFL